MPRGDRHYSKDKTKRRQDGGGGAPAKKTTSKTTTKMSWRFNEASGFELESSKSRTTEAAAVVAPTLAAPRHTNKVGVCRPICT